ncbi:MAG: glycosyltransferase [Bacteroidota bacterium]
MKIIIIGPAFPLRGGIANFNEALCRSLQNAGHDVSVISFTLQYPFFLFPGTTQYDNGKGPEDIRIRPMINSINPANWFRVAQYVKSKQPDLVIIRFWLPFMGPCLGTIARLIRKNTKVIAVTDNVIPHEKKPGDRIFSSWFLKSMHGYIAMSKAVLEDISLFEKDRPRRLLPHPVYNIFGEKTDRETALRELQLSPENRYILFFGIIRKYKGLDILLEAFSQFDYKKYKAKLLVAGEFYEDEQPYRDLIRQKGMGDEVMMHNHYIPSEKVKYYFAAADIVAQTYRSATQSGVAQIAYHFERPLLVTDVGGLAEIVPHLKAGYVSLPEPASVAGWLGDFYAKNRENEFLPNIIEEKKRFAWEYFVEGIESLYREL